MVTPCRCLSAAFVLLLVAGGAPADESEDRSRQYFQELGGDVYSSPGEPVWRVNLWWYIPVKDEGLKKLAAFRRLRYLWLDSPEVTDEGLKYLADLDELELLHLGGKVTDAGLKHLAGLKKLRSLALPKNVTGEGLKHLTSLKQLVNLDLAGTELNDEGLKAVGELKNLEVLNINFTKVTDDGLQHLAGLNNLRVLDIGANRITDKGMKALAALTELRRLTMDGITQPGMTGAGLGDLAPLQKLEGLNVSSIPHMRAASLEKLSVLKSLKWVDARGSVAPGADFRMSLPGARVITKDPAEDGLRPHAGRDRRPAHRAGTERRK
jgi:hypothetical protein